MGSAADKRPQINQAVPERPRAGARLASSGRRFLAEWRAHPAEILVTGLLLLFLILSAVTLWMGRPQSPESLRTSALYAAIWALWLVCAVRIQPTARGWIRALRGIAPWFAVMQSYNLVKYLIPAVHPGRMDAALRRLEAEWGMGSTRWTHALLGHPLWTDFFCAVYLSLFAWMIAYVARSVIFRGDLRRRFIAGFVLIYTGGFLGYMACPAAGPRYAYPEEWTWLSGGFVFALCNRVIANMGAKLDVFPSLHVALSMYMFCWQARHVRRDLFWGLPLTAAIWLSTIFLGFHYAPDLAAGAILGVAAFAVGSRLGQASISGHPAGVQAASAVSESASST